MRRNRDLIGPAGMGGMVGLWGASGLIKSVQTVSGTATVSVTINAVDTANTILLYGNNSFSAYNDTKQYWFARSSIGSSTTVTFTVATGGGGATAKASVLEFMPGVIKSIQFLSQTFPALVTPTTTTTIAAVNTGKSVVLWNGTSANDTNGGFTGGNNNMVSVILTNSTTVTLQRGEYWSAGGDPTTNFCVLEFY